MQTIVIWAVVIVTTSHLGRKDVCEVPDSPAQRGRESRSVYIVVVVVVHGSKGSGQLLESQVNNTSAQQQAVISSMEILYF